MEKKIASSRVQLGGKLGRHPRLGMELPGVFAADEVLEIVGHCLGFYKQRSQDGERFATLLQAGDFENFVKRFGKREP